MSVFLQREDGIRDYSRSSGLVDGYKGQQLVAAIIQNEELKQKNLTNKTKQTGFKTTVWRVSPFRNSGDIEQ